MAEKRKTRKKKEEIDEKPSKEEYTIAKYLRAHLPVKRTTLFSHKVEYFIASKAVECLLSSKWATNKKNQEVLFTTRESVVQYLNKMLIHKFFHRAKKVPVSQKEVKLKKKALKEKDDDSSHAEDGKDKKASGKKKSEKSKDTEKGKDDDKKEGGEVTKEKKKEKRKIKLDMHLEQIFVDGNEAYVWIYDPTPTTAWLIGGLLVVGTILLCLFPLWPSSVRKGVYYISIAAAGFLCVIVALIIIRIIIFCIIWVMTCGRHHLWILPNLTEDVGFFESFWPLFKYEYKGSDSGAQDKDEKKKAKDSEEEKENKEISEEGDKDNTEKESERDHTDTDRESEESGGQQCHNSGTDNGFEMVNQEELHHDKFS